MAAQFHWDPEKYLEKTRAQMPRFDELQAAAVAAIPFPPTRVLDLGIGTGETSRRILEAYPKAEITGLDSSPEVVFRTREMGIDVRLARMEDPLPDGPWDLVIAVLSIHHLDAEGKRDLLRRVREESRSLVIGDVVASPDPVTSIHASFDPPVDADELGRWAGAEITWRADDLAVLAASYKD